MNLLKIGMTVFVAAGTLVGLQPARADGNLIQNGNFSQETVGGVASTTSAQLSGFGSYSSGATLTGWINTAYAFVFTPGGGTSGTTADTSGATINEYGGYGGNPNVYLWGPGAGGGNVQNGLTTSPDGGSFVGIDGAYSSNSPFYQQVNNLTVGQEYQLSYYWATAQQGGFTGATTAGISAGVSDGTNVIAFASTPSVSLPSEGFNPWQKATLTFVADNATQFIGFIATGSPAGNPPFSLLDGVSLAAVPEPASWAVFFAGLVGMAGLTVVRRRRRRAGHIASVV